MMPDSTIEILGRIDTQIKLRGVRIESEGISAIIRKGIPTGSGLTLDASTIIGKHPAIGSDQLVSFVTWESVPIAVRKSTRPTLAAPPKGLLHAVRAVCNAELASYMRPSHILPLTWLPLSSNGKTDSKILLDIFQNLDIQDLTDLMSEDTESSSDTCDEVETAVFEVLKAHAPSFPRFPYPRLTIFECGLDSLAVIRFTSGLKVKFKRPFSPSEVMKAPTLKAIACLVKAPPAAVPTDAMEALVSTSEIEGIYASYSPGSVETVIPPFPIQPGVVARSAEIDTLYVQHFLLACQHKLSSDEVKRMKDAWNRVVAHHSILR